MSASTSIPAIQVAPFTVVVDNREQSPFAFQNLPARTDARGRALVVRTVVKYLPTGDYSIDGWESRVAVERKSLADLYGTLGQNLDRFRNEMDRLSAMEFAAVVIEATWAEICAPQRYRSDWQSKMHPRSVWGIIHALAQRHPVRWFAFGTRRLAEIGTFEILERFWRDRQ